MIMSITFDDPFHVNSAIFVDHIFIRTFFNCFHLSTKPVMQRGWAQYMQHM